MSGLLPRNQEQQTDTGNFNNLTTKTLVVSATGFINNLATNTFTPAEITTSTINGDPDLQINGNTTVEQSGLTAGLILNATTEPFISINAADTPVLQIGQAGDGTTYIDSVGSNALSFSTADAERLRISAAGIANDNTLTNLLGLSASGLGTTLAYKNNIADTSTAQTFTNKSLKVPSCKLVDNSDTTKVINFLTSGSTTGTNTQLTFAQTANRVITLPDATTTLVGTDTTQTLTNKTISGGVYISTGASFGIDFVTNGLTSQKSITWPDNGGTAVLASNVQQLANKSLLDVGTAIIDSGDSTKQILFDAGGTTSTSTTLTCAQTANRVITFPDATTTLLGTGTTQTLTNKTLDSAANTITVTNSPLSAVNVNNLLNQDVRTSATPTWSTINCGQIVGTPVIVQGVNIGAFNSSYNSNINQSVQTGASPTFAAITSNSKLTVTSTIDSPIIVNHTNSSAANEIQFQEAGTSIVGFGADQPDGVSYTWIYANRDYVIATNNTEFFRLTAAGTPIFKTNNINIQTAKTPATSSAAGSAGDFAWDSTYFYICIATNTWHRVLHLTW